MASIIWNRDPQEALNNPYEYNAQEQFQREAISISEKIGNRLDEFVYNLEDRTLEKAIWMLQNDALFAFKDSVILLEQKNHRIVGRLLRDILESLHLIEFLSSESDKAINSLAKWYNDDLIMHREFREYVKKRDGEFISEKHKNTHRVLSKFTHRSYKTLLYSYILGNENKIYYDEKWRLVPSIAMYYALLGYFGGLIIDNLKRYGNLNEEEVSKYWNESMEEFQIPRGYLTPEQKNFLGIDD
ncbi:hypothetical protein HX004_17020 [Myroides sp. 1354]|uniref:hypothetical protein n=1 Tax=unclassified Myroides TaxID=2642485 RepID=UPI002577B738|nr:MULTISPECIES: hypothetical protein [unclassified Myroides]MDM1046540.1 hypothetical protein [Myroides sp. R163-1]MDM1057459.1 hypothetical protein [Myroides sp. 1354]MDM1070744.1 hypothetical protein [Myroides sp. 1372]